MSTGTRRISHQGIIDSIGTDSVFVRIVQSSACAGCKIASHCSTAESKEKIVEVQTNNTNCYSIGEEVSVTASEATGTLAVFFGFVLPFIVLVTTISVMTYLKYEEVICALAGLGTLIPYYILIYLNKNYFKKVIRFEIDK